MDYVWLTREEFARWYMEDGKPAVPEVRIAVRLPAADKRLVNMLSGADVPRERAERLTSVMDVQPCGPVWRLWYCYFGTIRSAGLK